MASQGQEWMKVSGSPLNFNFPLDGEEILLNYPNDDILNTDSQPYMVDEISTPLVSTTNYGPPLSAYNDGLGNIDYDPVLNSNSQDILSQGQLDFIEGRDVPLKDIGLSDVSFGELEGNTKQFIGIFQSGNSNHPGPSCYQYDSILTQKKLVTKEKTASKTSSDLAEIISWPGDYKFKVKPSDGGNGKRCIFWQEKNKIYVARDYHIPFKFDMDQSIMEDPSCYSISTTLAYSESQYKDIPVLRCLVCKSKEKTGPNPDRLNHIVRCQQPHAQYVQTAQNRCAVICKVTKPPAGVECVTTNYMFTCLSSCKSGEPGQEGGMQRRTTAIVFNLLDPQGRVCGRDFFYVRICSAPLRDYNKDKDDETCQAKKRKSKSTGNGSVPPKVPKVQVVSTVINDDDLKPTSSSQETCYSDEEPDSQQNTIKLRSLMKKVKWALSYKHSENPLLRCKAKEIFSSVKMTNLLVENMKVLAEDQGVSTAQPRPSPDQGYQDQE